MQPRVHPFASSPVTVVVAAIAGFRINIVGALVGIINFHAAYRQGQLPFLTYVVIVVMIDDLFATGVVRQQFGLCAWPGKPRSYGLCGLSISEKHISKYLEIVNFYRI